MVAYFILSVQENPNIDGLKQIAFKELKPCAVSAQKIEQIKMMVRTHRAALDFDHRFCNIVLPTGTKPEVGNLRKVRKRKSTNL